VVLRQESNKEPPFDKLRAALSSTILRLRSLTLTLLGMSGFLGTDT
jgi:hypothetical protein